MTQQLLDDTKFFLQKLLLYFCYFVIDQLNGKTSTMIKEKILESKWTMTESFG